MRVVGLLRGVNLGPSRRLKMADLRAAVESLGHTDVETYLQSGNVVFTPASGSAREDLGGAIREALREAVGLDAGVLTRTGAQMAKIVAANPYAREDPTKVVVTFLAAKGTKPDLDLDAFAPEGLTVHGTEIYLDLPHGQARSPLLAAVAKVTKDDGLATSRNWRTVLALAEMSAE
jgi:uncharacterized protein (DUF1697 family)